MATTSSDARQPAGASSRRGVVLVSAGASWTVLSLLAMHLLGTPHHSGVGLFVHAFGAVLFVIGLGHLLKRSLAPLPGGSALHSAVRTP